MKSLDLQMILFVGTIMIQETWIYYGLPKLYYWTIKNENNHNKAA